MVTDPQKIMEVAASLVEPGGNTRKNTVIGPEQALKHLLEHLPENLLEQTPEQVLVMVQGWIRRSLRRAPQDVTKVSLGVPIGRNLAAEAGVVQGVGLETSHHTDPGMSLEMGEVVTMKINLKVNV